MGELLPSYRFEGMFGGINSKLGFAALHLAETLSDKPGWRSTTRRRWWPSDRVGFRATIDCLAAAEELQTRPIFNERRRGYLTMRLDELQRALPFSEGERHELVQTMGYLEHRSHPEITIYRWTWPVEDAGRRRLVPGRDLLDAWWAWRRSVFEFEGQEDVYVAAHHAAYHIAKTLVPQAAEISEVTQMFSLPPYTRL
jgi:hypothetical protein